MVLLLNFIVQAIRSASFFYQEPDIKMLEALWVLSSIAIVYSLDLLMPLSKVVDNPQDWSLGLTIDFNY